MALGRADTVRQRRDVIRVLWLGRSLPGADSGARGRGAAARRAPARPVAPALSPGPGLAGNPRAGRRLKSAACRPLPAVSHPVPPKPDATPTLRHHRPALRQRQFPYRPHHGVHPGRHLGAAPAHAGQRGEFCLRRRRPWRADHDRGRKGRQDAAAVRGRHRGRPQALSGRFSHRVRQLAFDRRAGEPCTGAADLPRPARQRRRLADQHPHRSSSSSTPRRTCSCPTASSRASARAATPRTSMATTARSAAPSTRRPT